MVPVLLFLLAWFWGTVSKTRNQDKDTHVVDVHFEDGNVSNDVWDQELYKLESQAYKDHVLQVGDVAYAPFPGKNPKSECTCIYFCVKDVFCEHVCNSLAGDLDCL
jgi:hypothetical protein